MLNEKESGGTAVRRPRTAATTAWQIGKLALWAVLGLLSAHATVYGTTAPFGVGAAAAVSGPGAPLVYLTVVVGYLLPGSTGSLLHYLAAVGMVAGFRWVLGNLGSVGRSRWFPPACAFVAVLVTGIAVNIVGGWQWYWVVITVCEGALGAGFSVFFRETSALLLDTDTAPSSPTFRQLSLTVVGAVVLMSVAELELAGISPGRIVAAVLVLLFARISREAGGAMAGTVLGVAMMLASGNTVVAATYSLGGLLAGWLMRHGRLASAGVFFAVSLIAAIQQPEIGAVLISLYESLTAAVLFLAIPPAWDNHLTVWFSDISEQPEAAGIRRSVVLQLDAAGQALHEVAGTVDAVSGKLANISEPDIGNLFASLADSTCRSCGLRTVCWQTEERRTMDALHHLLPTLREHGEVFRRDFPPDFAGRCARIDTLANDLSRRYSDFCTRETAFRRIAEIRSVVTGQFSGMAELLEELSERFSQTAQVDTAAVERVTAVCRDLDIAVTEVICLTDAHGRMTVDILMPQIPSKADCDEWAEELSIACGRLFARPHITKTTDGVRACFAECPRYRATVGMAQLCSDGERLCGDAVSWFEQPDGTLTAVLSDGMGCGGRAAVDGAMAANLTACLFKAGFGERSVLRLVNAALMAKSEEESLSTLDVARVDCRTGKLCMLKAGATFSYLLSGGRLSRFDRASLPAGILPDIAFDKQEDTLTDGDLLFMMSDGVLTDDAAWLEEKLLSWPEFPRSLQAFCEEIALAARDRQPAGHGDDVTALAILLQKNDA